jgi:hypothetical protein
MNSLRLLVVPVLIVAFGVSREHPSQRWLLELRGAEKSSFGVSLPGTLELSSAGPVSSGRSSGEFSLGDGSLGPLPPPLVSDPCVALAGTAELSRHRDSVTIDFSPHAGDCGLIARGIVHSDTVSGTWSQARFSGVAAQGPFRMWRQR